MSRVDFLEECIEALERVEALLSDKETGEETPLGKGLADDYKGIKGFLESLSEEARDIIWKYVCALIIEERLYRLSSKFDASGLIRDLRGMDKLSGYLEKGVVESRPHAASVLWSETAFTMPSAPENIFINILDKPLFQLSGTDWMATLSTPPEVIVRKGSEFTLNGSMVIESSKNSTFKVNIHKGELAFNSVKNLVIVIDAFSPNYPTIYLPSDKGRLELFNVSARGLAAIVRNRIGMPLVTYEIVVKGRIKDYTIGVFKMGREDRLYLEPRYLVLRDLHDYIDSEGMELKLFKGGIVKGTIYFYPLLKNAIEVFYSLLTSGYKASLTFLEVSSRSTAELRIPKKEGVILMLSYPLSPPIMRRLNVEVIANGERSSIDTIGANTLEVLKGDVGAPIHIVAVVYSNERYPPSLSPASVRIVRI
ncbi:MAG: hypothetical protein F7C35_03265 [Desulfurococcales archaeon]|nr:hypothetical protein [Desulfurococcales archaeon]